MTIAELQKKYSEELSKIYDIRETRAITRIVLEKILQLESLRFSLDRFRILTTNHENQLNEILERLITHEPVQYVLGETDFCGLKFKVNKHVLIPRPETEELVRWVISEIRNQKSEIRILDIGTGSGCIPISIAAKISSAVIEGCDISEDALEIAQENSHLHKTKVRFFKLDILSENLPEVTYDVIVSNPPYVSLFEKQTLSNNVLLYEPHLALFPSSPDDLIFYRKISQEASWALRPNGLLFFEINHTKGEEIVELMKDFSFKNVELKKDLSGKNRMVMGQK